MPKRMVDGDKIWTSDKLQSVDPPEWRMHYATLLPLALANGSFECNPVRILRDVYFFLRPDVDLKKVVMILAEFERAKLLFRWKDEHGKVWGFWVGITAEGLLPSQAHVNRGDYKKGKEPPEDLLKKFLEGEIVSGLTPGVKQGEPLPPPETPPVGFGLVRLGGEGLGKGESPFENPLIGQEDEMKADKQIAIVCEQVFGIRANLRGRNLERIKGLELIHKGTAVMRAFGDWAQANKDNPDIKDPVFSFLCEAEDILSGGTVSQKAAFDPKVSNLTDELVYQSGSVIGFDDRAKARLVLVQEKYTDEEITAVFKEWFSSLDTSNPKNVSFGGKNFAEIASQHCYALHRSREEKAAEGLARQKAVERLQEAANAERQESERKRQAEAEAAEIPLPI